MSSNNIQCDFIELGRQLTLSLIHWRQPTATSQTRGNTRNRREMIYYAAEQTHKCSACVLQVFTTKTQTDLQDMSSENIN